MPDNFEAGFEVHGFTRKHLLQLFLLVSIVPVQYFLTRSSSESLRLYELQNVITGLSELKTKYFNISYWTKLCTNILSGGTAGQDPGQARVMPEIISTGPEPGLYGTSMEVRSPRPPLVKYRIGQVIKHKTWKYRGIIVGWDEKAKAPESWLNEMHPKEHPEWRNMPNYAVLVDTRDRLIPQMSYVVQDNIEVITGKTVFHPLVDYYFEHFDGNQYVPRPWFKNVYPHD